MNDRGAARRMRAWLLGALAALVAMGLTLADFPSPLALLPLACLAWALPWWRIPSRWAQVARPLGAALLMLGATTSALDWGASAGLAEPAPWWAIVAACLLTAAWLPLAYVRDSWGVAWMRSLASPAWAAMAVAAIGLGGTWLAAASLCLASAAGAMAAWINATQRRGAASVVVAVMVTSLAVTSAGAAIVMLAFTCTYECEGPDNFGFLFAAGAMAAAVVVAPTWLAWSVARRRARRVRVGSAKPQGGRVPRGR